MAQQIFLDQLEEFHVKDATRLTPGTRVLFGHVPSLEDPLLRDSKEHPYGEIATVHSVHAASYNALHELHHDEEWATKEERLVFFTYERFPGKVNHRYLTDSGVEPYMPQEFWNDSNFTVILEDLEKSGLELVMKVSEDYAVKLDVFNSQVLEIDYDY